MKIKFGSSFFTLILLIFSFQVSTVFSQVVRRAIGKWSANGKEISSGDAVSAGSKINNNNKIIPNNDLIVIADNSCSDPLIIDCSKQNCANTYYVPRSYKSFLFPCILISLIATDVRGDDVLGIDGIVEIKNGSIDLTEKIKLFEEGSGIIYFSPLPDKSGEIPRIRFDSNKPLKIELNKPGLYKLRYKDGEYRILALESRRFPKEQKRFEEFVKLLQIWKKEIEKSGKEKIENSVIISMIWQHLDEASRKYNLLNEKKEKKK